MKIVIIGGVAAGTKAAAKSRRILRDAEIHIYTEDTNVSYSACGLPFYIEGNFEDWHKLLVRSVEEFEKSDIKIHLKHKVTRILPQDKMITVKNPDTNEVEFVSYDKLVIATGSSPFVPDITNINLKNIFTVKTVEDGIAIREKMRASEHITMLGGGYISVGLLEAFIQNRKKVTMIEKAPFILPIFDEDITSLVQNFIIENSDNRCRLIVNDEVSEFLGTDHVTGVLTKNGTGFETDMVVISTGVKPNVELAIGAGIEIGVTGAIKVNSRMQTNLPDIYACGDCTEKVNIISNTPVWLPLGSTANKEGRIAAINLCGGKEDFEGILGSTVTRYMGFNISMSGLSEKYAKSLGYDTVTVTVTKNDKAGYMPGVHTITLKLVADRRSHKILGIQAIGTGDADKKVNTISLGLSNGVTVEDLLDVDLTYSPPFSTSIDILHSAARILEAKLSE
ncbi:MAG: FAD-dependent oxidoreductase [bacterium]|nr:FAD-dependent oxidoreductase [bacterium]